MKKRLLAVCLGAVLLGGCAGGRSAQVMAPQAPMAEEIASAGQDQPDAKTQTSGMAGEQPREQAPQDVRLVPMDSKWKLQMQLLHPEGWSEGVTARREGVWSQGPGGQLIHVMTYQLRDDKAPMTVDQMLQYVAMGAPKATARQIKVDGVVSAFEVRYTQTGTTGEDSVLEYWMFGTTYKQTLFFSAPTPVFTEWEPVFRKIQAAFVHSNLDAEPLPGRP